MNAFVTGSRVYGTPTEQSDVDLCLVLSESDLQLVADHADHADQEPGSGGHSLRFGKLNLIAMSERSFEAWREATALLVAAKPVTRDTAIEVIEAAVRAKHVEA